MAWGDCAQAARRKERAIRIGVQKLCFCCLEVELPNSVRGREEKCKGMDNVN